MEAAVATGGCQAGREEDIASSGSAGAAYRPDRLAASRPSGEAHRGGLLGGQRWGDGCGGG